ncbi:MAG: DUF5076 domain-containing protein [Chiayiivirga sp.]|uniref:DUF5076 domain-containing protein n=1 Tax=Chiayiivirga sp. TaxID=2041042 RepID=UPI0025C042D8|nr:DUF5076 domain-containing protein [Chiayiivirga sp.]MCI1711596.1 DUF5076 domain-containing protein [Chiayiivirga sp.]MCI1730620.1 DUF5076 domain-containing protein [Chiayiivirga sp.]
MSNDLEELPIPDGVFKAEQKAEIARIWLADGDQVAVISPRLWDDPGVWGLMLVDVARHVAQAYAAQGVPSDYALQKIREAFDAEWFHPTEGE